MHTKKLILPLGKFNQCIPDEWNWCKNVSKLDYKKFISDMDVGVNLHYNWRD